MLEKIKFYRGRILGSEFIQNVFYLASTSALAQVIPFITLPILQKYFYGPAEFGMFTAYVVFSELIISVSSLKYEYAIVNESRVKNSANLLFASLGLVLISSLLTLVVLLVLYNLFTETTLFNTLGKLIFFVPVSIIAYGSFECINYWFNRNKKFYLIGTGRASLSFGSEGSKILFGLKNFNYGLVAGRVAGQITGLVVNGFFFLKDYYKLLQLFSFSQMKKMIVKHKDLAFFSTPGVLLGVLINYIYVNMFLNYYGQEVVGVMGVSVSYVAAAFSMLSVSFAQVFYRKIADISDINSLRKLYLRYSLILVLLSAVVVMLIYLIPSSLIHFLLGEKWMGMMPVMRTMVLWLAPAFVTSSLSFMYIKLNRQREMFIMDVFHLFMVVTAIYLSHIQFGEFMTTLRFFTGAQVLYYFMAFLAVLLFFKSYKNSLSNE